MKIVKMESSLYSVIDSMGKYILVNVSEYMALKYIKKIRHSKSNRNGRCR